MGERWLKVEEEAIVNHYPTASRTKIWELIPNRTFAQIGVHARTMGVHRTSQAWGNSILEGRKALKDIWSTLDNERLDRMYPVYTRVQLCAAFPSRTLRGILSHAQRRHLHRTPEATGREINIGRENARKG
jgi:hypothetical protein